MVKVWDLRKNVPLYELSTGNNVPNMLAWQSATSSLICVSSTPRFGNGAEGEWPSEAVHPPGHFPRRLHFGTNAVLQYDFISLV